MDYSKYNLEPKSNAYKETTQLEQDDIPKYDSVRKKKSLGQKFQETFLVEDMKIVRGHIVNDVLVPSLKELFRNIVVTSFDLLLFGSASVPSKRSGGNNYVDYSGYSIKGSNNSGVFRMDHNRSKYSVDVLYFKTKQDAFDALRKLCDYIDRYDKHFVTVSTYYQLDENDGTYTWADTQWGWSELGAAKVEGPVRVSFKDRNGNDIYESMYCIVMPEPIPLMNGK